MFIVLDLIVIKFKIIVTIITRYLYFHNCDFYTFISDIYIHFPRQIHIKLITTFLNRFMGVFTCMRL